VREAPFSLSMPGQPAVAKPNDKAWGFDEAQIEAARRGTSPQLPGTRTRPTMSGRPARPAQKSRVVPIVLIAAAVAAVGFAAWWWMQRSNQPAPVAAVAPRPRPPVAEQTPVLAPTTTGTVVDIAPPVTASTATIATPVASAATASAPAKSRVEKQTGGRVITNVPAPSTAPDPGRGKYDAMARQYAQNPAGTYTVQFELVCQTPSLAKAIAAGGSNVWFVPVSYRGQSCYRVFWGHFDSRDAAIAAAARIPGALRGSNPVVVSVPRS
jgi:septal ring-binding cell division protein DamX